MSVEYYYKVLVDIIMWYCRKRVFSSRQNRTFPSISPEREKIRKWTFTLRESTSHVGFCVTLHFIQDTHLIISLPLIFIEKLAEMEITILSKLLRSYFNLKSLKWTEWVQCSNPILNIRIILYQPYKFMVA